MVALACFLSITLSICLAIQLKLRNIGLEKLKIFDASYEYFRELYLLDLLTLTNSILVIFFVPGLLWLCGMTNLKTNLFHLFIKSFLLSVGMLIGVATFYKLLFHLPINSLVFQRILTVFIVGGLLFNFRKKSHEIKINIFDKKIICLITFSFLLFICANLLFADKISSFYFDQDYSQQHVLSIAIGDQGDIHEQFGRIASLKNHLWPYWDLEYVNRFGHTMIDPPFFYFLAFFLIIFLGESLSTLAISNLIILFLNTYIVYKIVSSERNQNERFLIMCGVLSLSFGYMLFLAVHPFPYIALIDQSFLMTLFILLQMFFLFKGEYFYSLMFICLAFLTQYESLYFSVFGGILYYFYYPKNRREILSIFSRLLIFVFGYVNFIVLVGLFTGNLDAYTEILLIEKFTRLDLFHVLDNIYPLATNAWPEFDINQSVLFLKIFGMATLFTGILLFYPKDHKKSKIFSWVGIIYLFIVFVSRYNSLRYVTPLVFLSMVVTMQTVIQIKNHSKSGWNIGKD